MKRKLGLLALSFALMLALTACGDKANARSNNSADNNVKSNVKAKTVTIDWRKPSENKPYPNMNIKKHNWLLVSINNQRVYVMNAQNKVLYIMNCSTGANNSTPRGTVHDV